MSGSINLFQFVCKTLQFQMLRQQQQQQQHLTSRATENDNAQRCLACLPARGNNFALLYRLLVIPRRTREESRRHIAEHVYLQTVKQEGQQARGGTQAGRRTGTRAAAAPTGFSLSGSCLETSPIPSHRVEQFEQFHFKNCDV